MNPFNRRTLTLYLVFWGASFGLLRLATPAHAAAGSLDASFGNGGKVTTNFGSGTVGYGGAVAIQTDRRIIVAGQVYGSHSSTFALARYNRDGSLDASFGAGGTVHTSFGGIQQGTSAMTLDGSQIVAAGYTYNGHDKNLAIVRYNSDGSLDASFGVGGKVVSDWGDNEIAQGIAMDGSKILVAGSSPMHDGFSPTSFLLVRYHSDGSLDASFGVGGKVTTPFSAGSAYGGAMVLDGSKIVVGGSIAFNQFALARYNHDGSLDTTFGSGGRVLTGFGSGANAAIKALVVSDSRILAAGYSRSIPEGEGDIFGDGFTLARYNPDGSLDATFGSGGIVTTRFWDGSHGYAGGLALAGSKILVTGTVNSHFALARYHGDGRLDTTFSLDGKVTTDFGTGGDFAAALAVDGSKIVVAGSDNANFALARYHNDASGNHPPTAIGQSVSVVQVTAKAITLRGSDPDGDPLACLVTSLPPQGKLYDGTSTQGHLILAAELPYRLRGDQVAYKANSNSFLGEDNFTFRVWDGVATSGNATVQVTIVADTQAPTIVIYNPPHGSRWTGLTEFPFIEGIATDNGALTQVRLSLYSARRGLHWTGTSWGAWTKLAVSLNPLGWYCTAPLPSGADLVEDHYTVTAFAFDALQHWARADSVVFINNIKPRVSIRHPANQATLNASDFTAISGQASDPGGGQSGVTRVTFSLYSPARGRHWTGTHWGAYTRLPATYDAAIGVWNNRGALPAGARLSPGFYSITATATDAVGTSTSVRSSFKIATPVRRAIPASP